ncbi:MFS transporter [Rossellomorea vietnamensis]|uniref:MFS transporter n=1 Tax=Rossellomorea vietnamensis TaxID=218284 RepID=UPI001CCBD782|nr:MFS transporter [Rossellomorea vietnamensis]MCA0149552.1 MFS transporter [Rossellomorea vietnamensis]
MMNILKTKNNIYLLYFYLFFAQLFFDRALWVIYLGDKGMTLGEIGVLEALRHLAIVLFEVPTGMIADLYGRKVSLVIGNLFSLLYGLFMLLSGNFSMFTLAFLSMGLMVTLHSGAEQAFAYDTLKNDKREKDYTRVMGSMTAISLLSLSLAKFLGGFMAEVSWEWVYGCTIITHVLAVIPLLFMKEPEREKTEEISGRWYNQWVHQFRLGVNVWRNNRIIHAPVILFILASAVMVIMVFYGQEYFVELGYSSIVVGAIFTIEGLLGVVMAKIAYKVEERFKFFNILYYGLVLFLVFFALFIFATDWAILLSFLILAQLLSLFEPIFSSFVQGFLKSNIRSTFLSLIGLMESFVIMISFPLFGYAIERTGFTDGFAWLLLIFFVLAGGYLVGQRMKMKGRM